MSKYYSLYFIGKYSGYIYLYNKYKLEGGNNLNYIFMFGPTQVIALVHGTLQILHDILYSFLKCK